MEKKKRTLFDFKHCDVNKKFYARITEEQVDLLIWLYNKGLINDLEFGPVDEIKADEP